MHKKYVPSAISISRKFRRRQFVLKTNGSGILEATRRALARGCLHKRLVRMRRTRIIKIVLVACVCVFVGIQILGSANLLNYNGNNPEDGGGGANGLTNSNSKKSDEVLDSKEKKNNNNLVGGAPQRQPQGVKDDNNNSQQPQAGAVAAAAAAKLSSGLAASREDDSSAGKKKDTEKPAPPPVPESSLSGNRIHGLPNITGPGGVKTSPDVVLPGTAIAKITARIKAINEEQSVRNEDIFGPVSNTTVVIVVQVHNRVQYLRQLITSMSVATGIENSLIIFSHDYYDDDINDLVNRVDFAKTMQIFYPFSIQTHPNEFPGESPNDCPRNAKKDQAKRLKCTNADWPDIYGHYREAKFTQTKHHWWWKANRIFDQLRATRNYDGPVVFLEEDHYVAEDFLPVLNLINDERMKKYPDCDIISMGTYLKSYSYSRDGKIAKKAGAGGGRSNVPGFVVKPGGGGRPVPARHVVEEETTSTTSTTTSSLPSATSPASVLRGRQLLWAPGAILSSVMEAFRKVDIMPWQSAKHNMGMAFTRSLWRKIHNCRQIFCNYDDYNWDWSLQRVSLECFKTKKLEVLMIKGPRVFHIGECGVHHKKKGCDTTKVVKKVQDILVKAKPFMYPKDIKVSRPAVKKRVKSPAKGNGGWGDHRDRALCMNMANSVMTKNNNNEQELS